MVEVTALCPAMAPSAREHLFDFLREDWICILGTTTRQTEPLYVRTQQSCCPSCKFASVIAYAGVMLMEAYNKRTFFEAFIRSIFTPTTEAALLSVDNPIWSIASARVRHL